MDNKSICAYPWIHVHAWADGKAFPCCMYDINKAVGNINNTGLNGVINSTAMKEIRSRMVAGKPVAGCTKCYDLEKHGQPSMRTDGLKYHPDYAELASKTNEDGSVDDFELRYLDIRYSNLCNFACVTCSPTFSSKWVGDAIKLNQPIYHKHNLKLDVWSELEPYLPKVKNVNFAGGEPLLMEDHWKIMNYWLDSGKTDQFINYTTNLSELEYKGQHITDVWSKFKHITLLVSVDGAGELGEWVRWGMKWDNLIANIKTIQQRCPHIDIRITPTLSVYNVLGLFDAQRRIYNETGISPEKWQLNILHYPHHLQAINVPNSVKSQFVLLKEQHNKWLNEHNLTDPMFDSVQSYLLSSTGHYEHFVTGVEYASTLDEIRGTNSKSIIPYLIID